jgi:hypothetical protein
MIALYFSSYLAGALLAAIVDIYYVTAGQGFAVFGVLAL